MVCVRAVFHANDGNHENDEDNEDSSDSYKQVVECWIRGNHANHENDENHGNPGCKSRVPQTAGLEIPEKNSIFRPFAIVNHYDHSALLSETPCTPKWQGQSSKNTLAL